MESKSFSHLSLRCPIFLSVWSLYMFQERFLLSSGKGSLGKGHLSASWVSHVSPRNLKSWSPRNYPQFWSSHFWFWFLVTFGDQVTKILRNLCLHFARQDGQEGKKRKENHLTKLTKIPKTKKRKYGMNETIVISTFAH